MHAMTELKETLERELNTLAKDDKVTLGSLDKIHKLTDTIKNIAKIEMLEEAEYSQRRDGSYGGSYDGSYGNSYGSYDGGSYARRRRDSMGRYTRENRGGNMSREVYSRGGKEEMIMHIEEMMNNASSDQERQALEKCLSSLENA